MNANEQKMWRHIQPRLQAYTRFLKVTRIETGRTARGISDLYGTHEGGRAWIELKYGLLTPNGKKYDLSHFNAAQRDFLANEYETPGGRGWLLVRTEAAGWYLIRDISAIALPNRCAPVDLLLACKFNWPRDINVRQLVQIITGKTINVTV